MAFSFIDARKKRWQAEAKQANGRNLPSWTRSDDSDHEDYDVTVAKKRRRTVRKRETDPNVKVSKIYGSRQRRDYDIPGYSFRELSNSEKRRDQDSDLPGDSLRESSVDPQPTKTADATRRSTEQTADTTYYITGGDDYPVSTQPASKTTTSSAQPTHTSHEPAQESESSGSGSDDSYTDGEDETAVQSSTTVPAVPAVSSALPTGQNLMVEKSHSDVHKVLLGVGCVVGFILIACALLIAWKVRKRNLRRKAAPLEDLNFQKPSRVDRILSKAPFIRKNFTNRQEWYTIPDPSSKVTLEKPRTTPSPKFTTRRVDSQFLTFEQPVGLGLYGADFSQSVSTIDTSFVQTGKPTGLYNVPKTSSRLRGTPEAASSVRDLVKTSSRLRGTPETVSPVHDLAKASSRLRGTPETVSSVHDLTKTPSRLRGTPETASSVHSLTVTQSPAPKESPKATPEPVSPDSGRLARMQSSRSRANSVAVSPVSTMYVEDTAVQIQVLSRQAPKPIRLSGGKTQPEDIPPMPTPKWNYGHIKRQTGASDLSSISSGFGDGDIIITSNNTVTTVNTARLPTPPSPVANPSRESPKSYHREITRGVSPRQSSLRSHTNPGASSLQSPLQTDSRRDTVSTQVSIDSRPRFHSVSSWVKQQSGQVHRAQHAGDTPPVPMLPPPEQELRYMMPDDEEPRRPEGV